MLKFIGIPVFVFLAVCHVSGSRIASNVRVQVVRADEDIPEGSIANSEPCGGAGHVSQFRVSGCQLNSDICKVPAKGAKIHVEMDFTPIIDMPLLHFRLRSKQHTGEYKAILEETIVDSAVRRNEKYTIEVDARLLPNAKGKILSAMYEVFNMVDDTLRLCVKADIEFV